MRVILMLAVASALASTPAFSQGKFGGGGGRKHPQADQKSAATKKSDQKDEAAYKAALDGLPDQKYDPWHNMR